MDNEGSTLEKAYLMRRVEVAYWHKESETFETDYYLSSYDDSNSSKYADHQSPEDGYSSVERDYSIKVKEITKEEAQALENIGIISGVEEIFNRKYYDTNFTIGYSKEFQQRFCHNKKDMDTIQGIEIRSELHSSVDTVLDIIEKHITKMTHLVMKNHVTYEEGGVTKNAFKKSSGYDELHSAIETLYDDEYLFHGFPVKPDDNGLYFKGFSILELQPILTFEVLDELSDGIICHDDYGFEYDVKYAHCFDYVIDHQGKLAVNSYPTLDSETYSIGFSKEYLEQFALEPEAWDKMEGFTAYFDFPEGQFLETHGPLISNFAKELLKRKRQVPNKSSEMAFKARKKRGEDDYIRDDFYQHIIETLEYYANDESMDICYISTAMDDKGYYANGFYEFDIPMFFRQCDKLGLDFELDKMEGYSSEEIYLYDYIIDKGGNLIKNPLSIEI